PTWVPYGGRRQWQGSLMTDGRTTCSVSRETETKQKLHRTTKILHWVLKRKNEVFMSKDFDQVAKARKRGRKRKPRMWKWEREIERVRTRVYAARLLLRFQGIESHFTPEQIAKLKAVANQQYDEEIGATNG